MEKKNGVYFEVSNRSTDVNSTWVDNSKDLDDIIIKQKSNYAFNVSRATLTAKLIKYYSANPNPCFSFHYEKVT